MDYPATMVPFKKDIKKFSEQLVAARDTEGGVGALEIGDVIWLFEKISAYMNKREIIPGDLFAAKVAEAFLAGLNAMDRETGDLSSIEDEATLAELVDTAFRRIVAVLIGRASQ